MLSADIGISSFKVFELEGASALNGYYGLLFYLSRGFDSCWLGLAKLDIVLADLIGISLFGLLPELIVGSLLETFLDTSIFACGFLTTGEARP